MSNNITVEQCQALLKSLCDADSNNQFLDDADAFILLAENAEPLIKNGKATQFALDAARKYRNKKLRDEHRCGGDDFNIPDQDPDPTADAATEAEAEEKDKALDELEGTLVNAAKNADERKLIIARLRDTSASLCAIARQIGVNHSTAATQLYRLKDRLMVAKSQGDLFGFGNGLEV